MSPDRGVQVLEPLCAAKAAGRGLGPNAVFGIMRQAGDYMALDSEAGLGAAFRFHLPASDALPAPSPAVLHPSEPPLSRGTILLAEDEESVRRLVERVLTARGFAVVVAPDGIEAMEEARDAGKISLLITDVIMPGRDGLELARELRRLDPDLPVLYISGYSNATILQEVEAEERSAFLAKPFTTDKLLGQIDKLLSPADRLDLAG
jgi:two-component system cell cycle sensor histidine kinase/response regulator CckA